MQSSHRRPNALPVPMRLRSARPTDDTGLAQPQRWHTPCRCLRIRRYPLVDFECRIYLEATNPTGSYRPCVLQYLTRTLLMRTSLSRIRGSSPTGMRLPLTVGRGMIKNCRSDRQGSVSRSRPMFVTNHVLSGVVIGRLLERHPVTAFVVGVGSHLALDMVPHWGCETRSTDGRQLFLRYAKRDGLLGLLAWGVQRGRWTDRRVRQQSPPMAGAVLLDVDKPLMHFFGRNPFPHGVRRIHARVQNESPQGLPNEIVFGLSCAVVDVAIAVRGRRRLSAIALILYARNGINPSDLKGFGPPSPVSSGLHPRVFRRATGRFEVHRSDRLVMTDEASRLASAFLLRTSTRQSTCSATTSTEPPGRRRRPRTGLSPPPQGPWRPGGMGAGPGGVLGRPASSWPHELPLMHRNP